MKPFLFEQVFKDIKNLAKMEENEGEDNAEVKKLKLTESEFSDLVDVLRQNKYTQLPSINALLELFWRLVGNKISPLAMTNVKSMSLWAECRGNNDSVAFVLIPFNWHDMLVADPFMQMGAMAYTASKAKDYWNYKFVPGSEQVIEDRARSYEAELLHFFSKNAPKFVANDYQKEIMKHYPDGMMSEISHYESRAFDLSGPPFPVKCP